MKREKLKKLLDKSIVGSDGFDSREEMLESILNDAQMLKNIKADSGINFNIEKIISEGTNQKH